MENVRYDVFHEHRRYKTPTAIFASLQLCSPAVLWCVNIYDECLVCSGMLFYLNQCIIKCLCVGDVVCVTFPFIHSYISGYLHPILSFFQDLSLIHPHTKTFKQNSTHLTIIYLNQNKKPKFMNEIKNKTWESLFCAWEYS